MINRQSSLAPGGAVILLLAAFFLMEAIMPLRAQEKSSIAMVTGITRELIVIRAGKEMKGKVGMDLFEGDGLKTREGCGAVLLLTDGSEMKMNQKTEITIKAFNSKQKNIFIALGEIFGKFLPQQTKVTFETPRGIAGIEGTEFTIKVDDQEGMVNVNEGTVAVGADQKTKITGEHCCSFKNDKAAQPLKAKFPEWHKEVKDYGAAIREKLKEVTRDSSPAALASPPQEQANTAIQSFIKINRDMERELHEVTPPEFMAEFHKELIECCAMRAEAAEAGLKLKEHPSDGALKSAYLEKLKALGQVKQKLVTTAKPALTLWYNHLNQFRESHGSPKGPAGKKLQQLQQHLRDRQGSKQQEN